MADEMAQNIMEEAAGEMPPGSDQPFKMPSKEELLAMLDTMGLGDEEKEELRKALLSDTPIFQQPAQPWTSHAMILIAFLLFIAFIFAFFGYKLYKSLKDREVKREEKKKQKQLRKKK